MERRIPGLNPVTIPAQVLGKPDGRGLALSPYAGILPLARAIIAPPAHRWRGFFLRSPVIRSRITYPKRVTRYQSARTRMTLADQRQRLVDRSLCVRPLP